VDNNLNITTRNGNIVVGSLFVPIRDIISDVLDRRRMDWITNRYPVTEADVLDAVDYLADHYDFDGSNLINLRIEIREGFLEIQPTSVSDSIFLKLIQFGRIFTPKDTNIESLFNKGFLNCVIESIEAKLEGSLDTQIDNLHGIIYNSVKKALSDSDLTDQAILDLLKEENEVTVQ